ncbi:MAG: HEAT repeat domain-containing protein [bacterium]|nr:HEAT repeat domain-containing protein [bacterium]
MSDSNRNLFIQKWIGKLNAADRDMSLIAAEKLGSTRDPNLVPELVKALKNRPDDVRASAIRALAVIRHRSAVPHLLPLLNDPNPMIATAAASALGEIGHMSAVSALGEILRSYKQGNSRHEQLRGINRGVYLSALDALKRIDTIQARSFVEKYGH